ncbi:probable plastid-lipid-associated protein 14, chloroplastic isoform X3 [Glycine max]|uniref:probable plastid-lipid-associated protein 14, chloroplastic isoform X3 n=1 Tax=Glycine max TaxID=3847 RepID=UPI00071924E1|nr:probable plastid-lipid-associated protein 14, chloroplastic isoform X3 [Glycine max]
MDPLIFAKFKSFLTKEYDPSCLWEFMLEILGRSSPYGNAGLQILDRNWGAGWHLLLLLLATKPSLRISFLHPADSKNPKLHQWLCKEEVRNHQRLSLSQRKIQKRRKSLNHNLRVCCLLTYIAKDVPRKLKNLL